MDLDALHQRLFELIGSALALPAGQLGPAFRDLVATVEADFRREEEMMGECGDARLHREQHARMQAGLHHAAAALERGDHGPARRALESLRDWLPIHIEILDSKLPHAARAN
jgi:hemerythrin